MYLKTKGLVKKYGRRIVVNDISVELEQGEIVGFLGPNGAGKTTTFYMMVGLIRPNRGLITLEERPITRLPMYKRARLGVGYLPQEPSVFRGLNVEENILAPLELRKMSKKARREQMERLIDEFSLQTVRKSKGKLLSGGERRRTEIARALASNPKFLLLDEPFAGVDPLAIEEIQQIVVKLKKRNIGVLITDHRVAETLSITDRVYILSEGSILKSGKPEELVDNPEVRTAYLGQNFKFERASWYS